MIKYFNKILVNIKRERTIKVFLNLIEEIEESDKYSVYNFNKIKDYLSENLLSFELDKNLFIDFLENKIYLHIYSISNNNVYSNLELEDIIFNILFTNDSILHNGASKYSNLVKIFSKKFLIHVLKVLVSFIEIGLFDSIENYKKSNIEFNLHEELIKFLFFHD